MMTNEIDFLSAVILLIRLFCDKLLMCVRSRLFKILICLDNLLMICKFLNGQCDFELFSSNSLKLFIYLIAFSRLQLILITFLSYLYLEISFTDIYLKVPIN